MSITPIRIQRRRTRGFNLQAQSPDGRPVVSVCRPGKWGNPFRCGGDQIFIHAGHRRKILDPWVLFSFGTVADSVRLFELVLNNNIEAIDAEFEPHGMHDAIYHIERLAGLDKSVLKDKHLACFCPIGQPCHADTLLKLANQ